MTHYRLKQIPTEKKIALFFTGMVFIIVATINGIVFYTTEQQWEYNKAFYADKVLSGIHTKEDAGKLENVRVFDEKKTIIFNAGIFSSIPQQQIQHNSIVPFNNGYFFISLAKTNDGGTICYAQDVTDFVNTRNRAIQNILAFSLISLILIYVIGVYFSRYILRPIRFINDLSKGYSLRLEPTTIPWEGNKNDDIGTLTGTMNHLFLNLREESKKTEQFSSDVSHEFKNSLSELKTHIQIMQAKKTYNEDCLGKMNKTVDTMNTLVESLILLARLDHVKLKLLEVSLREIIRDYKEIQHPKVVFQCDATVANIHPTLFCLAIGNIIGNAIKFTSESGKITVVLEAGVLTIEDDGIGIKPENIEKIWDRFYKESENREYQSGYGIGLSLTKKILDIHDFRVKVESTRGRKTTFIIDLRSGVI